MTPAEARAALAVVREDEGELTATERRVAVEFFSGLNAGNKVQSYLTVFPDATYGTASTQADKLLNSPRVKRFLADLHQQVIEEAVADLREWTEMEPEARAVIRATYRGTMRNRLAFEAAVYTVNRVTGLPSATVDVHVMNHERIAAATKTFVTRMSEERKRIA